MISKTLTSFLLLYTSIIGAQSDSILRTFSENQLLSDYDLAVSAIKEAHPGLYWYQSTVEFDSLVASERARIKDGMNSYDFFRIASRIVTSTKEGHCRIASSQDIGTYFIKKAQIIPLMVKMIDGELFALNNVGTHRTKGLVINKVNGTSITNLLDTIMMHSPKYADGFIRTGKIRYSIDYSGFAYHYADYFENSSTYAVEFLNRESKQLTTLELDAHSLEEFREIESEVEYSSFAEPIELSIDLANSIALLSIHSFRHTYYDEEGNESIAFDVFASKIDSAFDEIIASNAKNLVIDIRKNGGGTEGYEDYVFSYLTDKPFRKYKYVESKALSYSFLNHTQYGTLEKQEYLAEDLQNEFNLDNDGRYLRKDGFMKVEPPKKNPFKGQIFVLISGKTYSGGSELAGLLKAKSGAVFVGEETGGGFYGQTSGYGLTLTLPHTKIRIRIPLFKFVTTFESPDVPFGRGIIPDHHIQGSFADFAAGRDAQMDFALDLIRSKD